MLTAIAAKIYPAKTENALRTLHQHVCDASMTMHHRLSIFYYVLLDFDAAHGKPNLSEHFTSVSGVPLKYQIFMKGLWLLDRHQFQVRFSLGTPSSVGLLFIASWPTNTLDCSNPSNT